MRYERGHKRAVGLPHNQGSSQHAFGGLAMFEVRGVLDHASLRSDRNLSGPEVTRCDAVAERAYTGLKSQIGLAGDGWGLRKSPRADPVRPQRRSPDVPWAGSRICGQPRNAHAPIVRGTALCGMGAALDTSCTRPP